MAGRGPAPKNPSERRRRNKTVPLTLLTADGRKHGPELPDAYGWPPRNGEMVGLVAPQRAGVQVRRSGLVVSSRHGRFACGLLAWRPLSGQGITFARREIRCHARTARG